MKKFLQDLNCQLFNLKNNIRALVAMVVLFGMNQVSFSQATGIFESYAILSFNGGSNIYYDMGPQNTGAIDFNGTNIGSFGSTSSVVIKGGQNKTFKNNGGNVTGGNLYYRVWLTSGGATGAFTTLPMSFLNNIGSSGDQTWEGTAGAANILSGLSVYGNYTVEVYADAPGFPNTVFANNGGTTNYRANFNYNPIIVTSTGGTGSPSITYPTLAAAVTAINSGTAHTGIIVCSVPAGYTETAPAGGFSITATGTVSAPITFIKSGSGVNPVLTAPSQTSGSLVDAIFKLNGSDYVTFDGLTLVERSFSPIAADTAAATNTMTEFGFAFFYATLTNGCQNNTIQNCVISLNRTYQNTFGIYSNTRHTSTAITTAAEVTSAVGSNSNNRIYGNAISNVNYGIVFIGAGTTLAAIDSGNDIGGISSLTGNTITNWGNGGTISGYLSLTGSNYCIFSNQQINDNISFNTITSASLTNGITTGGILKNYSVATPTSGTITTAINNNFVTITNATTGTTLGGIIGINNQGLTPLLATATVNINNNVVQNCVLGGTTATTVGITAITNLSVPGTLNINGNSVLNNSITAASATSGQLNGITTSGAAGNVSINNNIVRGFTSTGTSSQILGISNSGVVVTSLNINNNQFGNISGGFFSTSTATSGNLFAISNSAGAATCATNVTGNDIRGIVYNVASSGGNTYLTSTGTPLTNNVSNNTFTNLNINTTGSITFINHSYTMPANGTQTLNNNQIITAFNKTGAGGAVTGFTSSLSSPSSAIHTLTNNIFSNITVTGATTITGVTNADGLGSSANRIVTGNIFNNWVGGSGALLGMSYSYVGATSTFTNTFTNWTGTSSMTGLNINSSANLGNPLNIVSNTINNLVSSGAGGAVVGINCSNTSPVVNINDNIINTLSSTGASTVAGISIAGSTSTNIFKNKIYDISGSNASSTVNGISISAGTTVTIYNNLIGDLRASAANAANPLVGINISGGTTANVYFNTVQLNATSSGALFGSSAIFASTTPTVNLRNNIFVNTSTANGATGFTTAYRRSTTTLGTYGSTSNNNIFYSGTPSATNLIFYDGTNADQTLATYKTRVSTRDSASATENITFLSIAGTNANFLHINPTVATAVESGAATISSFTTDYDGEVRNTTKPDIGADEGTFTPLPIPTITSLAALSGCAGTSLVITGTNLANVASATIGGTAATVTTTTATTATITIGTGTTGVVTLTSPSGTATGTDTFTVFPAPTTTWSASTTAVCFNSSPQTTTLAYSATTSSPINYSIVWNAVPANSFAAVTNQAFSGSVGGGNITINIPASTAAGVYTGNITSTNSSGCNSVAQAFTITINQIPTGVTATATPNNICESGTINLTSAVTATSIAKAGMEGYTPTRISGTTFTSIIPATNITTWRNALSTDDNLSNNQPIGFNFNYNGIPYSTFRVSTNGFLTFDSVSTVTGGGLSNPYSYTNDWTVSGGGLIIAPNWDDLQTAGNLSTLADLNASINYSTTGTAGSRVLTVEWKNMQDFNSTSTANYNWQIKLYELDGRIEFVYGTMLQSAATISHSLGLSGATVSATPIATQLLSQTIANTGTFGFTNQNSLNPVPASNTTITFQVPATPVYSWTGPNSFTSALANPTITAATSAASGVYNLVVANSITGCVSAQASTASVTVNPTTIAGTVSTNQTICSGTTPAALTLSGNVGNVVKWQSATNVGFTTGIVDIANTTTTLTLGVLTATIYYRAVVQSGACLIANSNVVAITVTPNTFNDTTLSACDTYTWANNGATYTTSGTYLGTVTGCVTQRLILTITPSTFNDTTISACDTYTWANNGATYTTSGTYLGTVTGCVTQRLILTITPSTFNDTTISACDAYKWANNGATYTTSGTYLGTVTGCVTQRLILTITPSTFNDTTLSACDTYTWSNNGATYTTSGTYLGTVTGCVTQRLILTITPSTFSDTTISACDTYTWSNNGATYTISGTYLGTVTGCVRQRLILTITPSTFSDTTISACDTYTWPNNGATYTTSGTYLGTVTGCVTQRLILTITPSTFSDTTISACDTYTWSNNGATYTISGTYLGTVAGCVTQRLILTITPILTPTFTQVAPICLGETLSALPTTSLNGVAGTWSPALNNTLTTTYTFTPTSCGNNTTMTIAVGKLKTWNIGWTPLGAPTSIDTVLINANYNATTDGGTINGCTMTVDNNAVVIMTAGTNIISNGKLTVTSGSVTMNNNANLLQTLNIANTGNITVKRNSSSLFRQDYTLWGSPVTGSQTLFSFSPSTLPTRFYTYDSTQGAAGLYAVVPSPSTTTFALAKAYHIRMPNFWSATVASPYVGSFTGTPNNGNVSFTMSNTAIGLGFNAVANPYPSAISMSSFVAANTNDITGTLYFWRKTNNAASPSYSTWTAGTFINNGEAQVTDPLGILSSGQGFLVEAKPAGTTVVFNNAMRVADNVGHFFRNPATIEYNRIWLNARNNDISVVGSYSQMAVGYITDATNAIDSFDGKYRNDGDISLSTLINTEKYAIQSRVLPFDSNDVVPMSFKATTAGNYNIAIDHVDGLFASSSDIYLRDNVTGTVNNLTTSAYNFAANAGTDDSRFELLYSLPLSTTNVSLTENNVIVFKNNGFININSGNNAMNNVKVFDIRGRLLIEKNNVNTTQTSIDSSSFGNQVLIVQITSDTNVKVSKKIVN